MGLFGIEVLELEEDRLPEVVFEGGFEVKGMKGGKELGVGVECGAVLGGCGRWRSRNRVDVGVRKAEI